MTNFYSVIQRDIEERPLLLLSVRGHGKSSSLKTILTKILPYTQHIVKTFDVSQSHYHQSPLQHRHKARMNKVWNIPNCVYELGHLDRDQRREYVSEIIKDDHDTLYNLKMNDPQKYSRHPRILYVFEEANLYFDSWSLVKRDEYSSILRDFISAGRNYKQDCILVATAEEGEISPSIRRRLKKIYGKLDSTYDLASLKRISKEAYELVKVIPKYHFLYINGDEIIVSKIPDLCENTPTDFHEEKNLRDIATYIGKLLLILITLKIIF